MSVSVYMSVCVLMLSLFCRFYVNPLSGDEGDAFVLHFYDLSAKTPHTMYHFKWAQQEPQHESTAMET